MVLLDLFAGIGGFSYAAHQMGWHTAAFVEKDAFCQAVLKKNFPNVPIFGDIKEFDGTAYTGSIDLVCGGFPCQPFSHAGKRKGTDDDLETFFYLDPPYVGANQGHYDGYTQEDFTALIDQLASIKGKFLLSSYQNDYLTEVTNRLGWNTEAIQMRLGVVVGQKKTEVLTWNYDLKLPTQQSLF